MTEQHPLTDEMCEILSRQPWLDPDVDVEGTAHDMRAAADWQLEQVIKWAQRNCWCWFEKSSQKNLLLLNLKKRCAHSNNRSTTND